MNLSEQLMDLHSKDNSKKDEKTVNESSSKLRGTKLNESLSMDKVTASFLYMTSKDGKFPNKKLHDWAKKGYLLKGKLEDDPDYADILAKPRGIAVNADKLADMAEDWNHHTMAEMVRLLKAKQVKHAEWLILIAVEQEKDGHTPSWLSNLRGLADPKDAWREKTIQGMKATAQGMWDGIGASYINVGKAGEGVPARYWAILKKHPEKDLVKEIESMKEFEPIQHFNLNVTYASSDKKTRMAINNAFQNLGRQLRKEYKQDGAMIKVDMVVN